MFDADIKLNPSLAKYKIINNNNGIMWKNGKIK